MIALILLGSVCQVQSILEGRFDHATADALQPAAAVDMGEAVQAGQMLDAGQAGQETLSLNTVHYVAQRFKDLENATGVKSVRLVMLASRQTKRLLFVPSISAGAWPREYPSQLGKYQKRFNLNIVVSAIFFQVKFENNGKSALLSASRDFYLDRGIRLRRQMKKTIGSMAQRYFWSFWGEIKRLKFIAATTCADFNCERLGKAPLPVEQQARMLCYACTDDLCCRDCSSYANLCYDKGKIPKPGFPDCEAAGCNLEEECCQDKATCYSFKHRCEAVGLIMPDDWKKKECPSSECQEMGECCVRPNISAS